MAATSTPEEIKRQPLTRSGSLQILPPSMSELRLVLLGNLWSNRSLVGNFILGEKKFDTKVEFEDCLRANGQFKGKDLCLINTPDLLLSVSEDKLGHYVENCVRLCDPGPHVLLLVLQPEDFTEEHRLRLCRVLQLFGSELFDHSMVLILAPRDRGPGESYQDYQVLKEMIKMCRYRYLKMGDLEHAEMLTRLGQTATESTRECLSCAENPCLTKKIEELQKVIGEQEEEIKKNKEDLKRLQKKINEQTAEIELKAKQLKEKDASINRKQEEWKKDEKRWKKQEDALREDCKRKIESAEKFHQSELKQRERAVRKLEQCRKEMERKQEAWDTEKRDMWERTHQDLKQNLEEEKCSYRKLLDEYQRKRRKWTYCFFVMSLVLLFFVYHFFTSYYKGS